MKIVYVAICVILLLIFAVISYKAVNRKFDHYIYQLKSAPYEYGTKVPTKPYLYYPTAYSAQPFGPKDTYNTINFRSAHGKNRVSFPYYTPGSRVPKYISSVDHTIPLNEINTEWYIAGILVKEKGDSIFGKIFGDSGKNNIKLSNDKTKLMNLYIRIIAPGQNLYQYKAQDKDGFMIPIQSTYVEDGDIIKDIPGKPGKWIFHSYPRNKYVYI
ncbi:MAG TPA: hypothetical protein VLE02_01975 [Nitrosarchaeum sp.]|nr:hypothetical protein [Nitrosarchaeum sp.]